MLFSVSGESLRVPTRDRHKLGALDALERRGKAMRDRARAQNTPANAFHKASHLLKRTFVMILARDGLAGEGARDQYGQ